MKKSFEPFRTIVADPPWKFGDSLPNAKLKVDGAVVMGAGAKRGASKLYRTMPTKEIEDYLFDGHLLDEELNRLSAGDQLVAPDALLFLWRVSAMQRDALRVMQAWGFEQKSELVWNKTDREDAKLRRRIMEISRKRDLHTTGDIVDIAIEEARRLSFGMGHYTRGAHETCLIGRRGKAKVLDRSVRSVFFAPVGAHSEKPEEFYRIVEKLSPGPYLELFARRRRPGWTCVGDEL